MTEPRDTPELTLGPIAYHWPREDRRDFYARIADEAPIGTVYLGEMICSKRMPFFEADLPGIAERLERAGKRVVWSSLAEVMLKRERRATTRLAAMTEREVEINNAAGLAATAGRAHRIGPMMNVYNEQTLAWLAARGARHVTLPVELPASSAAVLAGAARRLGVTVEVQVFGRASLAVSARCYHARAHGRTRDNCRLVCGEDLDGLALSTLDDVAFLRVNGIQTQSESYISLIEETPAIVGLGIGHLRLMPQWADMVGVASVFRGVADGALAPDEGRARLASLTGETPLSNGFWHGVSGNRRIAAATGGHGAGSGRAADGADTMHGAGLAT